MSFINAIVGHVRERYDTFCTSNFFSKNSLKIFGPDFMKKSDFLHFSMKKGK